MLGFSKMTALASCLAALVPEGAEAFCLVKKLASQPSAGKAWEGAEALDVVQKPASKPSAGKAWTVRFVVDPTHDVLFREGNEASTISKYKRVVPGQSFGFTTVYRKVDESQLGTSAIDPLKLYTFSTEGRTELARIGDSDAFLKINVDNNKTQADFALSSSSADFIGFREIVVFDIPVGAGEAKLCERLGESEYFRASEDKLWRLIASRNEITAETITVATYELVLPGTAFGPNTLYQEMSRPNVSQSTFRVSNEMRLAQEVCMFSADGIRTILKRIDGSNAFMQTASEDGDVSSSISGDYLVCYDIPEGAGEAKLCERLGEDYFIASEKKFYEISAIGGDVYVCTFTKVGKGTVFRDIRDSGVNPRIYKSIYYPPPTESSTCQVLTYRRSKDTYTAPQKYERETDSTHIYQISRDGVVTQYVGRD